MKLKKEIYQVIAGCCICDESAKVTTEIWIMQGGPVLHINGRPGLHYGGPFNQYTTRKVCNAGRSCYSVPPVEYFSTGTKLCKVAVVRPALHTFANRCVTCGSACHIYSGEEGTNSYEPLISFDKINEKV
jgi:hypothetical protein